MSRAVDDRTRKRGLRFELYVAVLDEAARRLVAEVEAALAQRFADRWRLEVVEVLAEPHRALSADVFATPTLVRTDPLPVGKVLGELGGAAVERLDPGPGAHP